MHGGKGSGAPTGAADGAWKHGRATDELCGLVELLGGFWRLCGNFESADKSVADLVGSDHTNDDAAKSEATKLAADLATEHKRNIKPPA
jgi:hypothetical protein